MLIDLLNLNGQIVAVCIMAITYAVLFTEKYNRAIVAMFGALAMIVFGVVTEKAATASIDFNTVNLLVGMMIIISVIEKTGFFPFMSIWVAKKVKADPRALLAVLALMTAVLSGYIDNVTTVLLMTPVVIQMTRTLEVPSFPYLVLIIFACNIGGAATLIGDPPNVLVGSHLNLTFMDFAKNMLPLSYFLVIVLVVSFDFIWGRKLRTTSARKEILMQMDEKEGLHDRPLLKKSLFILLAVILFFMLAHRINLQTGTIAMIGAAVSLLMYTRHYRKFQDAEERVHAVLASVDWVTIFFFVGLFIIVAGLEATGVLDLAAHAFIDMTDGTLSSMVYLFLWIAAMLSSLIDNIPFVATMVPVVDAIEQSMPSQAHAMPLWWALLMGTCYGGNATIIASSANVIVAGIAYRYRSPIKFLRFMLWGIPVTIVSVLISHLYIYLFLL